jgi:primosomal protein N' (replication factor Y) (superfamily II helicase)
MSIKSVLVPYPIDRPYDYAVPDGMDVADGDYVVVPLGARNVAGVVWGEGEGKTDPKKLKSIVLKYDLPGMPEAQRKFIDWAAHYTMTPLGSFLKLSLSVPSAFEPLREIKAFRVSSQKLGEGLSLSPKHKAVIKIAADGLARRASELAREAGVTAGVVKTLFDKGLLEEAFLQDPPPCRRPDIDRDGANLSKAQRAAADHLIAAVISKKFSAALLDGVTGSGKTEVYFEAIASALKEGRQALILLPEIALSNAFLARFRDRFGCAPALWHSSLSDHQRKITWRGVASGESRVVVGARSALFLPYKNLGIIVVDEEHDPAYKQEEGVIYNARDMAVVRASLGKFPVALVSATPSLETMQNVWLGKYDHLELPDRHGGAGMPDIHLIDLRKDKPDRHKFIAPSLVESIKHTLEEEGGQVLLFLNRRGYAPLTLCRTCGHRFECPRCTAWLIEHRKTKILWPPAAPVSNGFWKK